MEKKDIATVIYWLIPIVLIIFKVIKVIDISWGWVLLPIWLPFAIIAGIYIIIAILFLFSLIAALIVKIWR